jgi:hypothetical protein
LLFPAAALTIITMRPHIAFCKCLARALAKQIGAFPQGFAGEGFAKALPGVAADAWKVMARSFDEEQRRQILQATLQKSPQDLKEDLPEIVQDLPPFKVEFAKKILLAYLIQIPSSISVAVRRPSDPAGKTVPTNFSVTRAEDLLKLLPKPMPTGGVAPAPKHTAASAPEPLPLDEPETITPEAEHDEEEEAAERDPDQPFRARKRKGRGQGKSKTVPLVAGGIAVAAVLGVGIYLIVANLGEKAKDDLGLQPQPTAPTQPPEPTKPSLPASSVAPSKPVKPVVQGRRFANRALLVGLRNYAYASTLNPLVKEGPSADPLGLFVLAKDLKGKLGFAESQIGHLTDVRRGAEPAAPIDKRMLEETLGAFLDQSRPEDSVLLVYVGHATAIGENGYLVPPAGERNRADTLVALDWLYKRLEDCKARHKLVIFDLAPREPADGPSLGGSEAMSENLANALAKTPANTQVWVSCGKEENSIYNGVAGQNGSVFLQALLNYTDPGRAEIKPLLKEPVAKEAWDFPPLRLAAEVNRETASLAKQLGAAVQTPQVHGKLGTGPDPGPDDKPAESVSAPPPPAVDAGDVAFVNGVIVEAYAGMPAAERPPADRYVSTEPRVLVDYHPDYKNDKELKAMLAEKPVRAAVLETCALLQQVQAALAPPVVFQANATAFKNEILKRQEGVAVLVSSLERQRTKLEKLLPQAKMETKRWQAHFDLVYVRLLGAIVLAQEHNYVLGVGFRKDNPEFKDKNHNGWRIVPQERIQQKEMRDLVKIRLKHVNELIKTYEGTPWESLGRKELATSLGRLAVEGKVN